MRRFAFISVSVAILLPLSWAEGAAPPSAKPGVLPYRVAVLVYPNVELLDFAGPTEVFEAAGGLARHDGQRATEVYLVAPSSDAITSFHVVDILPRHTIDTAPKPDIVVIPGGWVVKLTEDERTMAWIRKVSGEADVVMSVCNGALALAENRMLDGLRATTHWGEIEGLRRSAPNAHVVENVRFVDNGRVMTTAGVMAGIDGALHLTARFLGRRVAEETARSMEYAWRPEPEHVESYSYLNPALDERGQALQQASIYESEGSWQAAEEIYESLTDKAPEDFAVWRQRGQARHQRREYALAVEAFERAVATDHTGASDYYLARSLAILGQHEEALDALVRAFAAGFARRDRMQRDPDLASLRDDSRFRDLVTGH